MVACVLFLKKAKASLFSIGKDFFIKKTSVLLGFLKLFVFLPRQKSYPCLLGKGKAVGRHYGNRSTLLLP